MNVTDIKSFSDLLNVLIGSTPEMLLIVGLICLGYVVKLIAAVPNKYIPRINLIVAMIVYPLISKPGDQPNWIRFPVAAMLLKAMILFAVAWVIHRAVLKKFIDKFMPVTENGDTKIVPKPKEP